jgi:hypothetical protein
MWLRRPSEVEYQILNDHYLREENNLLKKVDKLTMGDRQWHSEQDVGL